MFSTFTTMLTVMMMILLLSLSPSAVWGRSFHECFLVSTPSINTEERLLLKSSNNHMNVVAGCSHIQRNNHRRIVACNVSKNNDAPNYLAPSFYSKKKNENDSSEDDENNNNDEEPNKRGIFRRIRDRVSATFGNRGSDEVEGNQKEGKGDGYKPNPLDGLRLRLAMAMAGLSEMNVFQRRDEWVVACTKTRVGPGQIVPCVVNGLDIIVFASRDGKRLDAFANSCPHLGSPFDLATIERKPATEKGQRIDDGVGDGCVDCIVCPVHRTAFEIQSGDVRGDWCPYPPVLGQVMGLAKPKNKLVKFAVRLKGKNVEVRINTRIKNVLNSQEKAEGMTNIK